MWTYNVARELLGKSGLTVKPDSILLTDEDQMRSIGAAMRNQNRDEIHCIKTHLPLDFSEQALAHMRILTPYRNPRDAVLSRERLAAMVEAYNLARGWEPDGRIPTECLRERGLIDATP